MIAIKPIVPVKAVLASRKQIVARRVSHVVRAEGSSSNETEAKAEGNAESTVFYAGKNYTQAEWKEAVANGTVSAAPTTSPTPAAEETKAMGFGDLMAFSGAPEIINGRLAMLGFVAALGAELSTGESVLRQFSDEPTGIILTAITFWVATLIPMLNSAKREAFGPLGPDAELTNGRAAMLGFASLLVIESLTGKALF